MISLGYACGHEGITNDETSISIYAGYGLVKIKTASFLLESELWDQAINLVIDALSSIRSLRTHTTFFLEMLMIFMKTA